MKVLTAAEMRECDRVTSERFGVPSLTLMENAGTAVAQFALTHCSRAERVTVICGKGNNGGDGFVAARKLHQAGKQVLVVLLGRATDVQGDAAAMAVRMIQETTLRIIEVNSQEELAGERIQRLFRPDLIIDAILGTGFKPPVSGLIGDAIKAMNASAAPMLAVDIPSGATADDFAPSAENLRARANAIVTFTAPHPAHIFGALTAGPAVIAPIGSPEEAIRSALNLEIITAGDIAAFAALRAPDANKGSFGHALIIGGSLGKSGAAAMAGMAALRAGVGLSTVATAKSVLPLVAGFAPEIMTEPLAETDAGTISLTAREYGRLDAIVQGKTVLALGPGISRHPDTAQFVRAIIDKYPLPTVVDADGLNAFEGCAEKLQGSQRPLVLTPHPGEMARLTGLTAKQVQAERIAIARKFAQQHRCVLVLKGHRTLVAQPDGKVWVNPTGNPGMASGGTGDILTGMVAGLIAQNPSEVAHATAAAVYLHGLAGDVARESVGEHSLVATDLLRALPEAFRRARDWAAEPEQTIFP